MRSIDFNAERHRRFADLSGDVNPMHMDAVAARRTLSGAPVVHGIHTLLCLLDVVAEQCAPLPPATTLKARFRKAVYVGEWVDFQIVQHDASVLRARGLVDGVEVLNVSVGFGASPCAPQLKFTEGHSVPPPAVAVDLSLEQIDGRTGRLRFATAPREAAMGFPHAADYLGSEQIAALMCCSCLVGMVVPGLHSLFGALELWFADHSESAPALDYVVIAVDRRFGPVRLGIRSAGLSGVLETLCRPAPVIQPRMTDIASLVSKDALTGTTALIIGGSRGLGEVTAKLIAAGGGRVIISYHSGDRDAAAVAAQINDWGGHCDVIAYDATQAAAPQLATLPHLPTHWYYFATPPIARRKNGLCDPRRLEQFMTYYVTGFNDLAMAALRLKPDGVAMFYPSTVYVENRPAELTEYAMAKAAGEVLCADLHKYQRGLRVLMRRLPRLSTDQTSSIVPLEAANPVEVMLPIILQMQGAPSIRPPG